MTISQKPKPTQGQLAFLDWEFGAFFHFGIRSFFMGHRDWDNQAMPLDQFNPVHLDCDQWVRTVKEAGANYAILVAKHHDGFANWPSQYTEFSVKNTPWKDGKGDVVAEFVAACRNYDVKVGLYYSPAQWGEAANFKNETEYDDYFIHQISELLSNYGKIDYLWFDGCGSENHTYDTIRIVKEIRRLQPEILIFNMWDPDTRWVGNECGVVSLDHTNQVNALDFSVQTDKKDALPEFQFLPGECDFMMRRSTWFNCEQDEDTVKSVAELIGIYEMSVGRGANFLINIGPDSRGRLPEKDTQRILEFGAELRKRFSSPLEFVYDAEKLLLKADSSLLANCVILEEDLTEGESIQEFEIYGTPYLYGNPLLLYVGRTIGHKAICHFPAIKTSEISVKIKKQNGTFTLKTMNAYFI